MGDRMKLNTQQRLAAVQATVVLLRTLERVDGIVTYREFAEITGLMEPGSKWEAWHRTWCADVLDATAVLSRETLDFGRVVNAQTGAPGAGVYREPVVTS